MGKQKKNRQGLEKTFKKKNPKVGRKLPKAQNVTNTKFKTKTIQIIRQLKNDQQDEATTKRKVNIRELLSQCQHYNFNVRLGAAQGVKELLEISAETVIDHLGLVIDRIGSLMTDKDSNVREASLKVFACLFEKVPANRMSTFFSVLCAHLCCAMTHINTDVQQDSLSLFDLLLKTYPILIVSSSHQLLSNFVEQISKQKFKNDKLSLSVAPNRSSSQKWQSKVLTRLYKLLSIVLNKEVSNSGDVVEMKTVFVEQTTAPVPIAGFVRRSWDEPGFVVKSSDLIKSPTDLLCDINSIQKLVKKLFPLLLECWVECHDSEKNDGSLLYPFAVNIRTTVLQTVLLLIQFGDKNSDMLIGTWQSWLLDNFNDLFVNYFMTSFPYELVQVQKVKKQKMDNVPASAECLNLTICQVMTKFINTSLFEEQESWISTIIDYVSYILKSTEISLVVCRQLLQVLNPLIYTVAQKDKIALLDDCVYRYKRAHPLSQEKQIFIQFLSKVVFGPQETVDLPRPLLSFLSSLTDLLLEVGQSNTSVSENIVVVIKSAITMNSKPVMSKWQENIEQFYGADSGLYLTGSPRLQKCMAEILYWLPSLTPDHFQLFNELIHSDKLTSEQSKYFVQVLHQRYLKIIGQGVNVDVISDHLGFLILLMLDTPENNQTLVTKLIADWSNEEQLYWKKQLELNTFICQLLVSDFNQFQILVNDIVWNSLETKVEKSMNQMSVIFCLLTVLNQFSQTKSISETLMDLLIKLTYNITTCLSSCEQNLVSTIENVLCKSYLCQFITTSTNHILKSTEEVNIIDLCKMLSSVLNMNNIRTFILESTDISIYLENFEKVQTFVYKRLPNFINEKWLSEIEYFILQLNRYLR